MRFKRRFRVTVRVCEKGDIQLKTRRDSKFQKSPTEMPGLFPSVSVFRCSVRSWRKFTSNCTKNGAITGHNVSDALENISPPTSASIGQQRNFAEASAAGCGEEHRTSRHLILRPSSLRERV